MRFLRRHWLIISIFFLALTLRLWNLGSLPFGFHADEVMNGYVGRFILQNGVDLYGNRWPVLYFDNFGDYPNVLPMYLSGVFTFLFGVNEFAVRFPIALMGALTVFPLYILGRSLFVRTRSALWLAFFAAVMPWHLMLSRATAEGVTASFVFLCALALLFTEVLKKRGKWWMSLPLFALTYLLYPGFRVFIPLALLPLPLLLKRSKVLGIIIVAAFFFLTFSISRTTWGKGRFDQTSVFQHNQEVMGRTGQYIAALGPGHVLEARIFHNKAVAYSREIAHQYLQYFSPHYLFTRGGKPPRYLVPDQGLLYLALAGALLLVFSQFVLGVRWGKEEEILAKDRQKLWYALLFILLVSPLPAALTLEDVPNIHRSLQVGLLLLFPMTLLWEKIRHWRVFFFPIRPLLTLLLLAEFVYFWHQYSRVFDQNVAMYRNDDQRVLAQKMPELERKYSRILLPAQGGQPLYQLFYEKNFDAALAGQFSSGIYLPRLRNLEFVKEPCPSAMQAFLDVDPSDSVLFIDKSECDVPPDFHEMSKVQRVNLTDSYRLLELVATRSARLGQ